MATDGDDDDDVDDDASHITSLPVSFHDDDDDDDDDDVRIGCLGDLPKLDAVLLPHVGSATASTRLAMVARALENLHAGMAGDRLTYCANPEVYRISG